MRFTHLHLQNWRNFSNVAVDLDERVFVVGPNASGKSNLLDAFRFLHDVAAPDGGLQRAVADRRGVGTIRFLGSAPDAAVVVHAIIEGEDGRWTYFLMLREDEHGNAVLLRERVLRNSQMVFDRPDDDDAGDPLRLRQTSLEQVSMNRAFRPIAEFLASVAYLHLTPELLRDPKHPAKPDDPFGSDLLYRMLRTPRAVLDARMKRLNAILRVALPQLDRIELDSSNGGAPHLSMRFRNWRPSAHAQNEHQLSDGTLRLIGLLWALMDGDGPLLLEEPELSLHAGVVRHLPSLALAQSARQTIISTHSLDLLSDEGIAAEEVLLLEPAMEGTRVTVAADDQQIRALLDGGLSIGDAVIPGTAPAASTKIIRAGSEP